MNLLKIRNNQFHLTDSEGKPISPLGHTITVVLRRSNVEFDMSYYQVEIKKSLIHDESDGFSKNRLATFVVTNNESDGELATRMFANSWGQEFRLKLVDNQLVINGLFWDRGLQHVRQS